MKFQSWLSACALAGGLAVGPVGAQPVASPSAPITLRAALDAAWERSVSAREAGGQRRRAAAEGAASGSFLAAPPAIDISHRDDRLHGGNGKRETELGLSLPLWLPGQRAAHGQTAEAAVAQARAAEQAARLRLAGELREAAWQIAALRAEARQADAETSSLKQLTDDVERRVRAGDLAPADALAAQAEQLAAVALQVETRQRLQAAQALWTLLTGLQVTPDLTAETAADHETPPAPDAAAQHPERLLARQSVELARQRLALVRLSQRDAPELSVGVRQDLAGRGESGQGSVVVGLRLPLGTAGRNQPLEAAASAEWETARTAEQRLQERLDSEIATARQARDAAQEQQEAATTRARLLRERAALIDIAFRAGQTPLPELLRARAAAAQADSDAARHTAARGLAHARLQQAFGRLP